MIAAGWVHASALFAADAATDTSPAAAADEAGVLFDDWTAILTAGGAGLSDVVRVGIVMRFLQADRPIFDKIWPEQFGDPPPARSAIQSASSAAKAETPDTCWR